MNGRVIEVQRVHLTVALDTGDVVFATVRGGFHETGEYPKVGDFVRVSLVDQSEEAQAVIEEVLPRRSVISRLDQETRQAQVLVTNVDLVFIVMGLDGDFNVKRLERYLRLAEQSQVTSVIVLNKADMAGDVHNQTMQVAHVAGHTPIHVVTAKTGEGLSALQEYFTSTTTAVLLGSSGAGKSTITNWFLNREEQDTASVRSDDSRGRHTTTTRQLFALPGGGYVIDTPGMRELGLVDAEVASQTETVSHVEALATECTFRNCDHEKSAGCAVQAAVASGELEQSVLDNYLKLQRELAWQQDKTGGKARYAAGKEKRQAQAYAAAKRRKLMGR